MEDPSDVWEMEEIAAWMNDLRDPDWLVEPPPVSPSRL